MLSIRVILVAVMLGFAVTSSANKLPQRGDILDALDAYLGYCRERDGTRAASMIDPKTVDYYETVRGWALRSDKQALRQLPLWDQIQVLMVRGYFSASDIEGLGGRDLFAKLVDAGGVSGRPVSRDVFGAVEPLGDDRVRIQVRIANPQNQDLWIELLQVRDSWQINIAYTRTIYEATKEVEIRTSGRAKDEYLKNVINIQFGDIDYERLWVPLKH